MQGSSKQRRTARQAKCRTDVDRCGWGFTASAVGVATIGRGSARAATACLCALGLVLLRPMSGGDTTRLNRRPSPLVPPPRPLGVLRLTGGWGPARDPAVWGRGPLTGDGNSPTRAGEEGFAPRSFAHRITRHDLEVVLRRFGWVLLIRVVGADGWVRLNPITIV